MDEKNRKQILETRQKLVDLVRLCEWDLILEKYREASDRIKDIKQIMDKLIADLVVDALN